LIDSDRCLAENRRPMDFLIRCLRPPSEPCRHGWPRETAPLFADGDWGGLIVLAKAHKVLPLLHHRLKRTCPEAVPIGAAKDMADYCHVQKLRTILMIGALLRVLDLLKSNGIAAIPFKGPSLSAMAYGDLSLLAGTPVQHVIRRWTLTFIAVVLDARVRARSRPHDPVPSALPGGHAMSIPSTKRLVPNPDGLATVVDGEMVFLNQETEQYYGLDEVGTRMWQLLTSSDSIQSAYEKLQAEYDIDPERLRDDLDDLIGQLVERGLVNLVED
jgi:hypothetical protein